LLALLWLGMYAFLLATRTSISLHGLPWFHLFGYLFPVHFVSMSVALVVGGWLADRYGSRNLILSSIGLLAMGTLPRMLERTHGTDIVLSIGSGVAGGLFFGAAAK